MNRETWLMSAVTKLSEIVSEHGATVPPVRVSVGFPKSGGKGNAVIGQCWAGSCADDNTPQIFIHPSQSDGVRVLDILLHELVHATVGNHEGHKGAFKRLATACGLTGKMTATVAGDDLKPRLVSIMETIGEYPHSALNPASGGKKQGTRLIKCECLGCGYTVRTTAKWLEMGAPLCPQGEEMRVC